MFTFVANDVTAQNINPADYVEMTPLWEAAALELDPQSFAPYTKAFTGGWGRVWEGECFVWRILSVWFCYGYSSIMHMIY